MKINFNWPQSINQNEATQEIEAKITDDIASSLDDEPGELSVFITENEHDRKLEGSVELPNGTMLLSFDHSLVGTQISTYISREHNK